MFCPCCGGKYRVTQESQTCQNCGVKLPSYDALLKQRRTNSKNVVFPEPPMGNYKGGSETLLIQKDGVAFLKKNKIVPFYEIYDVSYYAGEMSQQGFLCIREWEERNIPLITESVELLRDDSAIGFWLTDAEKFYSVYTFLKQCADRNHAANPGWREDGLLPIIGTYKDFYGSMEIGLDAVRFSKKVLFQKRTEHVILYKDVGKVVFEKATEKKTGGIWVRALQNRNIPIRKLNYASTDVTALDFSPSYNERMEQVYQFLQSCAHENEVLRASESDAQINLQESADIGSPDLEYYYQRYKPNKEKAIAALRIDMGIGALEAGALIDRVFNAHCQINSNPSDREVQCPKCMSRNVALLEKHTYPVKMPYILRGYYRSPKVRLLASLIRLATATTQRKAQKEKIECICLNCGNTWLIKK